MYLPQKSTEMLTNDNQWRLKLHVVADENIVIIIYRGLDVYIDFVISFRWSQFKLACSKKLTRIRSLINITL